MAEDDGHNPGLFQTVAGCAKIAGRIELALFGEDGRHGMVKDISDIKNNISLARNHIDDIKKWRQEDLDNEKEKGRDWVDIAKTVVATVIAVGAVAILSWGLSKMLP